MARITGTYDRTTVAGEEVAAFIPHTLPPSNRPLLLDAELRDVLARAEQGLARLELASEMAPSTVQRGSTKRLHRGQGCECIEVDSAGDAVPAQRRFITCHCSTWRHGAREMAK